MAKKDLLVIEMNNKEDMECFNFREKLKIAQKPYDYFKEIENLRLVQVCNASFSNKFGLAIKCSIIAF